MSQIYKEFTLPDQSGRTAIVTGANIGLGYETSKALAGKGARVIMACRSREKGEAARSNILGEFKDAQLTVESLDVSSLDSVRRFAERISGDVGQLDLLINNAGVMGIPLARNSVGHELQLAINHLGPFALTGSLLPMFRTDLPARIVNVGSLSHRLAKLHLDDINFEKSRYGKMKAYARSKLAFLTFSMELNRRLRQVNSNVMAVAAHPGFAATEIGVHYWLSNPKNPVGRWINRKLEKLTPVPADAARSILFAALDPGVQGGDYYGPGSWLEIRGEPARARLKSTTRDVELGRRLWSLSESLTGIRYLE